MLSRVYTKTPEETTLRIYEKADTALPADNIQSVEIPHTDMKLTINPFPTLTEKDVLIRRDVQHRGRQGHLPSVRSSWLIVLDEMTTRTAAANTW